MILLFTKQVIKFSCNRSVPVKPDRLGFFYSFNFAHKKSNPVPIPFSIFKRKIGIPSVFEVNQVATVALWCKIEVFDSSAIFDRCEKCRDFVMTKKALVVMSG